MPELGLGTERQELEHRVPAREQLLTAAPVAGLRKALDLAAQRVRGCTQLRALGVGRLHDATRPSSGQPSSAIVAMPR